MNQGDIDLAKKMKAGGSTWKRLGEHFGCDPETVKRAIDPEFAALRRAQINERRRSRNGEETAHIGNRRADNRVPIEDAHQRLAEIPEDRRDTTGRLLGDPLFERSALYAKQEGRI